MTDLDRLWLELIADELRRIRKRIEASRIAELEAALRGWRENNECSPTPDGVYIMVPARHIDDLLGR